MQQKESKNRINDPIKDTVSNCHRTRSNPSADSGANDDSDQDSSASKYVVKEDQRERRDGPGGN